MSRYHTVAVIVILLLIAVVPWAISATYAPLQPLELAQTPTFYAPTEVEYLTLQAAPSTTTFSIIGDDGTLTPMGTALSSEVQSLNSSPKRFVQAATETPTVPPTLVAPPTATIPLPEVRQPTGTPVSVHVELTEASALELLRSDFPELNSPTISISPQEIRLTGNVGPIGGGITIVGMIRLEANKLVMDVTYVSLNGVDVTQNDTGQRAARAVNIWLQSVQAGQRVQTYTVVEDAVIYDALQSQEYVLPTPIGQSDEATEEPFLIILEETQQVLQPASDIPLPATTPLGGSLFGTPSLPPTTTSGIAIPLAVEVTATHNPADTAGSAVEQEFTNEDFRGISIGPLGNVTIAFSEHGMLINGQILPDPNSILSTLPVGAQVELFARVENHEGRLIAIPEQVVVNGQSAQMPLFADQLVDAINVWLAELAGGSVERYVLTDGSLTINPVEATESPATN